MSTSSLTTATGLPVVEAARLESAAEPGSIFVSALVRSLVGSRGSHAFERVGALELKGLAGPVETFRVTVGAGEPTPARRSPRRWRPRRPGFHCPIGSVFVPPSA